MLFRLLPVPLCVMKVFMNVNGLQSQTLKVHPVASKTLTQKIPVYAAPERLVGDFSFSIVFKIQMDQSVEPLSYVRGAVTSLYPKYVTIPKK